MSSRVVFDTNVLVASQLSSMAESSNSKAMRLWYDGQIQFLYTDDTIREYAVTLIEQGVDRRLIATLISLIQLQGNKVRVRFFHLRVYPSDPDDIAFVLCAANGEASHLLTYDHHLTDLDWAYDFSICTPAEFLTWFATHHPEA